ncbi:MAG: AsmA family protein [Desulfobacterales bacterium]|jgi:AsmA protein|nr:AsmA family protein [Desulfobacterales bacterium]
MKKGIKWVLFFAGGLAFVLLSLIIIPMFLDFQKFSPQIERLVSDVTGRPFEMKGELRVSLFPWASIEARDVSLGNPAGFEEKNILIVKSFEARIKFMPFLLSGFKDIQVKRFILDGARIVLIKNKNGLTNWELKGKTDSVVPSKKDKKPAGPSETNGRGNIPIDALMVDEFAIMDGSLLWIDDSRNKRFSVSNINLKIQDLSLDRPLHVVFSVLAEKHKVVMEGDIGPVGKDPGKGTIPLDLTFNLLEQVTIRLKGDVTDMMTSPGFTINMNVSAFSPKKVAAAFGQDIFKATGPSALDRVACKLDMEGSSDKIFISGGLLELDDSKVTFSFAGSEFSRPDIQFELNMDQMDLNRYKPPATEQRAEDKPNTGEQSESATQKAKTDYEPLRSLVLDGRMKIGQLKVDKTVIREMQMRIGGKNGVFHIDPLNLKMYEGDLAVNGTLNFSRAKPEFRLGVKSSGINVGPMIKDLVDRDLMAGKLRTEMTIQTKGEDPTDIKKNLNGKGEVLIEDGAIKGIDLVSMVRNTDGAFGLTQKAVDGRKTIFSNFIAPISIKDGTISTEDTKIVSTLFRVQAAGQADLVKETLDFRIEPTVITTSKEDARKMKDSERMIPVLVKGTFSSPQFLPDLRGVAKKQLEEKVFESEKVKKLFEKEELKPIEKDVKSLFKGLLDSQPSKKE